MFPQAPLQVVLLREMPASNVFFCINPRVSNKHGLLKKTKSHLFLKTPVKKLHRPWSSMDRNAPEAMVYSVSCISHSPWLSSSTKHGLECKWARNLRRYGGRGQQLTCLWIFLNGLQPLRFEISHSSVFETYSIHRNSSRILHIVRYIFINVSKTLWPFQVSETIYPAIKCNPQKPNSSTCNLNLNPWYHRNVSDSIAPSKSETEGVNFVTKKKAWRLMFIAKNTHLNIRLIH